MEKIFERLLILVDKLENGSQSKFAKKIGCPQTTFNGYLNEKAENKIRFSLLQNILVVYPNISRDWLFFGEGPIFQEHDTNADNILAARIEALENEVKRLQKKIFVEVDGEENARAAGQE